MLIASRHLCILLGLGLLVAVLLDVAFSVGLDSPTYHLDSLKGEDICKVDPHHVRSLVKSLRENDVPGIDSTAVRHLEDKQPSLKIRKTVARHAWQCPSKTLPAGDGDVEELTVEKGTSVAYCFKITNNGDFDMTNVAILDLDSQLSVAKSDTDPPPTLDVGDSWYINGVVVIDENKRDSSITYASWVSGTTAGFVAANSNIATVNVGSGSPIIVADTSKPTREPTPQPTSKPTKMPTRTPTRPPTPTVSPTASPTSKPTKHPTSSPSKPPTGSPTALPTPEPTAEPTEHPIKQTKPPTGASTDSPTTFALKIKPTLQPTLSPTKSSLGSEEDFGATGKGSKPIQPDSGPRGTGEMCSEDGDCKSETCRNGACMASAECFPLKHKYGEPFDVNTINIVFVGSGFNTTSHKAWRDQAAQSYGAFEQFNMFSRSIEQLNVFVVDPAELSESFCSHNCLGINRLLCCDPLKAHELSKKCFDVGANLQTVVVHNSPIYGGAGYAPFNLATISTHPQGPLVAVHELGHSLFELTDEYSYGPGSDSDPNCSGDNTCSKWADLVGKKLPGHRKVGCRRGCKANQYFVGEKSYMDDLGTTVGAVNERYTCCTYLALTKKMPSYCDIFDFSPNYLIQYCKNDFQNYGVSSYDNVPSIEIPSIAKSGDTKYIYISNPLLVTIQLRKDDEGVDFFKEKPIPLKPGLFPKSQVLGDYNGVKDAAKSGVDSLVKVKVVYQGGKEMRYFARNVTIDVPVSPEDGKTQDVPRYATGEVDVIHMVLDVNGRRFKKIRPKIIP